MRRSAAFTVIELLVISTIIVLLLAVLLPTLSRARARAQTTRCASNLRHIGTATMTYTAENSDWLPGPQMVGQMPRYHLGEVDQLADSLTKYMGLIPTKVAQDAPLFLCPAWVAVAPPIANRGPVFFRNNAVRVGKTTIDPCGYPGTAATPDTPATAPTPGHQIYTISDPAKSFFLQDTDQTQRDPSSVATAGWYDYMAPVPAHGTLRNRLFYDFHAETVPIP